MFFTAAQRFLTYLKTIRNCSEHTLRNYAIDLNHFKFFLESRWLAAAKQLPPKISLHPAENDTYDLLLPLEKIDKRVLRQFISHQTDKGLKRRSIVRSLSSLRSFFKFCLLQKLLQIDPSEELDTPKIEKKIPNPLSYENVVHLFAQPDLHELLGVRDRAILELFYSSGLRVSELVALDRNDFDSGQMLLKLKGKGKKERVVPITCNASRWIEKYLYHPERYLDMDGHLAEKDPSAVFLNRFGTRLTPRSVDRLFDKYLKLSGLAGKPTPHTIRHTIATHWLKNGMDLKTIKELLGHASLATTTIYTKVSTALKKKVFDSAHPRA